MPYGIGLGPVAGLGWALVGSVGAAVQTTAGTALTTLAWGANENRTVNNLLVLWCTVTGSATLPTTPSGWAIGKQVAGTSCSATIYLKVAAGSDAAPTVNAITSGRIAGQLAEFAGLPTTTATADQTGSATGTSSPITATQGGADAQMMDLLLACGADFRSVARASNDTWTSNNATFTLAGSNNGTSSTNHYSDAYALATTANASADTAVMTLSITTSVTGLAVVSLSLRPWMGGALGSVRQAVGRASTY